MTTCLTVQLHVAVLGSRWKAKETTEPYPKTQDIQETNDIYIQDMEDREKDINYVLDAKNTNNVYIPTKFCKKQANSEIFLTGRSLKTEGW
eukprot:2926396-Amphidinium_carterae.1